jgi:hypothetical protein
MQTDHLIAAPSPSNLQPHVHRPTRLAHDLRYHVVHHVEAPPPPQAIHLQFIINPTCVLMASRTLLLAKMTEFLPC